jgi:signal transduction histidine kinase
VLDERERERSDLAHELHEQLAQELAAVLLGLDSLASGAASEESASKLASVRVHVAETLEHCKALAVSLRPPLLDQIGLVPALERLAERAGAEPVRVDSALTEAALGPALQTEVYRSVEEALARVSGKLSLAVSLEPTVPELRVSVRSLDGTTLASDLGALEARLELLGGTLTAGGHELVLRLPIEPDLARGIAVFPQSRQVETPDGGRRSPA